jgi:non-specific serine/threonine protein kinase
MQQSKVFVIGGFGGPQRVELYDAAADRWERAPDLPIGVDHAMAATSEGLQSAAPQGVFVFGGYLAAGGATARSFRFDATAGRWEEIASMPGPRAAGAAVEIAGRIYIVGGADGARLIVPTYEYNVVTRQWRSVAAIPTPRDHLAAVVLDAKVCAVGGRRLSLSLNLAAFECYDPRADIWQRMPDAPTARGGIGAAAYDRRVYVAGGEQPTGTYREVDIFDARTNAWTRGPDLPTPRHGIGVVVVEPTKAVGAGGTLITTPARLLVLTGGPTPGGSQTSVCEAIDLP